MSNKLASKDISALPNMQVISWVEHAFLAGTMFLILFRLIVWKLFPGADVMVVEDLSNLMISSFQLALGAAFFFWSLTRHKAVFRTGFEWPSALLLSAASVTLLHTIDFSMTIRLWLALAGNLSMFYVLANVLRTDRRIKLFLFFILGCAALTASIGVYDYASLSARYPDPSAAAAAQYNRSLFYILTTHRATSLLGWPNSLAGYLFLIFPFALFSLWGYRGRRPLRTLLLFIVVVLILCLVLTFALLSWVSFLAAGFLLMPHFCQQFKVLRPDRVKDILRILSAILLAGFVLVAASKNLMGSMAPRLAYYSQAGHLIWQKVWTGYGYGTFGLASRPLVNDPDHLTNYVHNTYLQWWVECGVLGAAGAVVLLIVVVFMARKVLAYFSSRQEGWLALAVVWGLAAFMIDNFFSFTLAKPNISVHGWALMAVLAALYRRVISPSGDSGTGQTFFVWAGAVYLTSLLVLSLVLVAALLGFHHSVLAFRQGQFDTAGRLAVRSSLLDRWSAAYPLLAGNAAANVYSIGRQLKHVQLAEQNYLEAVRREPLKYNAHFMLGRVYLVLGERDKALRHTREAKRLSPVEFDLDMKALAGLENRAMPRR